MFAFVLVSLVALFFVTAPAAAQSSSTTTATNSASSSVAATVASGSDGYTYVGCYNETTSIAGTSGTRALANGKMEANNTATVESCLKFCAASDMQYAGLEYSDECWCAPYLSSLSAKLDDSKCNLACKGNDSEICGGSLTITLYNLTKSSSSSSSSSSKSGSGAATIALSWAHMFGAGLLALVLGAAL